jgi:hypothetical protein
MPLIKRLVIVFVLPAVLQAAPVDRLVSNVTEAADFTLVYELPIPDDGNFRNATPVPYSVDNHASLFAGFDRVAYYLELEDESGLQWVYVSMDPITDDASELGLPHHVDNPVHFRQTVSNLHVLASSNANLSTGVFVNTGNVEIWPSNYNAGNAAGVPHASSAAYDWGDGGAGTGAGYGSFQVHNHDIDGAGTNTLGETLFAYNHWGNGGVDDLGIGNRPGQANTDWTFSGTANGYTGKNLLILVREVTSLPGPASLTTTLVGDTQVVVAWETVTNATEYILILDGEEVARSAVTNARFTCLSPGTLYEVEIRAVTPDAVTAPSPILSVTTDAAHVFDRVPEAAEFQLLYSLDIPLTGPFSGNNPVPYCEDLTTAITQALDRVAYYLELENTNGSQWVYASMDVFNDFPARLGLPHDNDSPYFFAQVVSNLQVFASTNANVSTGAFARTGNIEFGPSNYGSQNSLGIPNAGGSFDFGDDGFSINAGYGSFQVHNHDIDGDGPGSSGEVLLAYNRWGQNSVSDIGIGNRPASADIDWTFSQSADQYVIRALRVLGRPAGSTPPPPAPEAVVVTHSNLCAFTLAWEISPFTSGYIVRLDGQDVATVSDPTAILSGLLPETVYQVCVGAVGFNGDTVFSPVIAVSTVPLRVFQHVPEAVDFDLVYALELENDANYNAMPVAYCLDHSGVVTGAYDRVAYFLELDDGVVDQWVYVSMDAFTTNVTQVGLPHSVGNPVAFQRVVTNMHVIASTSANVTTGVFENTGLIEFWPSNYGAANANGIPNASDSAFDFGDSGFHAGAGHGSFQVHNFDLDGIGPNTAGETLFAYNRFGPLSSADSVGIGNRPTGHPDWTFTGNSTQYAVKNLLVLVRRESSLADSDQDGVSDADEAFAGTDPNDPHSFPSIAIALDPVNPAGALHFQSVVGRSYRVQLSPSLSPPQWLDLVTIPGDGSQKTLVLPTTGEDQLYYQLLIEQP